MIEKLPQIGAVAIFVLLYVVAWFAGSVTIHRAGRVYHVDVSLTLAWLLALLSGFIALGGFWT